MPYSIYRAYSLLPHGMAVCERDTTCISCTDICTQFERQPNIFSVVSQINEK